MVDDLDIYSRDELLWINSKIIRINCKLILNELPRCFSFSDLSLLAKLYAIMYESRCCFSSSWFIYLNDLTVASLIVRFINIEIIYLPPYSPELNPVERLWLYIKQHTIKNKIYETISLLEDSICDFMKNLKIEQIKQICNYDY